VSHRDLDEQLSTDYQPVQCHQRERKLAPGEIVRSTSRSIPRAHLARGEVLAAPRRGTLHPRGVVRAFLPGDTDNQGRHVIHTAVEHDSYLQLPVIRPTHRSGSYVYR